MRKLKMMALIGASALSVSAASTMTAQAQPWGYHGPAPAYDTRLTPTYVQNLDNRIVFLTRRGAMSFNEAHDLRADLRAVTSIAYRAQSGHASRWEVRRLQDTVNRVEAATSRYAYNDRHDWRR